MKNPITLTEDNKTMLIGLLSILFALWTIFYLIPNLFISLFNTLLGNIMLLIVVVLVAAKDIKIGLILIIIFTIILTTNYKLKNSGSKEGFWTEDSKNKFTELQELVNPHLVFDLNKIQEQASQEEVDYYFENGTWPWSPETQDLYLEAINKNVFVRTYPQDSLNQAMKVYNEKIILQILSWQAKEGQFLLNGLIVKNDLDKERDGAGSYGVNSGLETNNKTSTLIKCSSVNNVPEIIRYTGDEGILGSHTYDTKEITDYSELEKLIPGFTFLNGTPCNPCSNININDSSSSSSSSSSLSCPFTFQNRNQGNEVSNIWKHLWSIM